MNWPKVSLIVPVLNEREHLQELVDSFLKFEYSGEVEIFLVDGGSTDGSYEELAKVSQSNTRIKVLRNPERYVSNAFNHAFKHCSGEYISLMGAHAIYPRNYLEIGVKILSENDVHAIGGPLKQSGKSKWGKVIAKCMSSSIGVGNTEFRTSKKRQYVDSVAFAIYKREVFEKVGLFDEELLRNQDDEFHYRMNQAGLKILMVPEMESEYFVRESLNSLYKQYFQYGLFKPLALKKVHSGIRLRHFVPMGLAAYLFTLPIGFLLTQYSIIPLILYLAVLFFGALKVSSKNSLSEFLMIIPTLFVLHFSYGLGSIFGIKKIV